MRHRLAGLADADAIPLSKFRWFGLGGVSRVEWRAPRPVQSRAALEASQSKPLKLAPPHHQLQRHIHRHTSRTAHQESHSHSHYARDDFTPAVRCSGVSTGTTITLLPPPTAIDIARKHVGQQQHPPHSFSSHPQLAPLRRNQIIHFHKIRPAPRHLRTRLGRHRPAA